MSELPTELSQLLAEGKRAHEPDPTRLGAVYQRVLRAPPIASEYDLRPSTTRQFSWTWLAGSGVALLGAVVLGALIVRAPREVAAPAREAFEARTDSARFQAFEAEVSKAPARSVEAQPAPVRSLPRPEAPAGVAPAHEANVPSSDWPVATRVRAKRERRQTERVVAEPVLQVPPETSDAVPAVRQETSIKRDQAASLREEVRLIARARTALAQGEWAAAEGALHEHLIAYPIGQLHVERRALLLRARCMAGDLASARRLHAELRSLVPGSSLLRSVERSCPQLAR
jgi:hypothetical protein